MNRAQIMFVDDDAGVLEGLRRQLWRRRETWDLHWAGSAGAALQYLSETHVDVVVTDMQMPGISGAELLEAIRTLHPGTARLVLSGHADHEAIIAAAGPTQQYLSKPCPADVLDAALTSALRALGLMADPTLRSLIGSLANLPKPPRIYTELTALIARPDTSAADVSRLLEQDVSSTTEVLKLVNSSFFGLATDVSSIDRAVALLGLDVIQALVLAGNVLMPTVGLPPDLDTTAIAEHGMRACLAVRRIGRLEGWEPASVNALGLAALLHDVGLLVLASAYPDRWQAYLQADRDASERDRQTAAFGCTIGQSSAYLLELWGFPQAVVTTLAVCPLELSDLAERTAASPDALALAVARELTDSRPVAGSTAVYTAAEGGYLHADRLAAWRAVEEPVSAVQDVRAGS